MLLTDKKALENFVKEKDEKIKLESVFYCFCTNEDYSKRVVEQLRKIGIDAKLMEGGL